MARKTAAVLKHSPIETAERRYEEAKATYEKAWAENDKLVNNAKAIKSGKYNASLRKIDQYMKSMFGAWDALARLRKAPKSEVPRMELQVIAGDVLQEHVSNGQLQFKAYEPQITEELVSFLVMQRVREEDIGPPPLCKDCG